MFSSSYLLKLIGVFVTWSGILSFSVNASNEFKTIDEESLYKKGLEFRNASHSAEAINCFLPLAKEGYVKAQHNLAMAYYNLKEEHEAYGWFKYAADKGFQPSVNNLKRMDLFHLLLNDDVIIKIASFLDPKNFMSFSRLSKRDYSLSHDHSLVLSSELTILKGQICHNGTDELYYKMCRTKDGLKLVVSALEALKVDPSELKALAHKKMGVSRLLGYTPLIHKQLKDKIPFINELIKVTSELWKNEVCDNNAFAQFNYGYLLLASQQYLEASHHFERALNNGFIPASNAWAMCEIIRGEEEAYMPLILSMHYTAKMDDPVLLSDYSNLIDATLLILFHKEKTKELAYISGFRTYLRRDFVNAEKLFMFSATLNYPRAYLALSKIYSICGRIEDARKNILLGAQADNRAAQIKLALEYYGNGETGLGATWLNKAYTNTTSFYDAIIAYKIASFLIKQDRPNTRLYEFDAKMLFNFMQKKLEALEGENEGNQHSMEAKEVLELLKDNNKDRFYKRFSLLEKEYTLQKLFMHGKKLFDEGRILEAEKWWSLSALSGDSVSINNLGVIAKIRQDYTMAQKHFYTAAQKGYLIAVKNLAELGYLYWFAEDKVKAKQVWLLATEFNHIEAKNLLDLATIEQGEKEVSKEVLSWFLKKINN